LREGNVNKEHSTMTTTTTTRRAVLAGAAALPVLSLPAISAPVQVDPVFAAIEEHRRLKTISDAAFFAVPKGGDEGLTDEIAKAEDYAGDRDDEACDQLAAILAMTPTTAAGCISMLRYLGAHLENSENGCAPFYGWTKKLSEPAETLFSRIAAALDGKEVQS
jgi:hypothetical protein